MQTQRKDEWIWEQGRGGGMNWEIGIGIYTLPCVSQMAAEKLPYSKRSSRGGMGRVGGMYKREGGIYVYIYNIANSLHCTAETNTTL